MQYHHSKGSLITSWPKTLKIQYTKTDWQMDKKGYFLIEVDHQQQRLLVGFCTPKGKPVWKVAGEEPISLYYTIFKQKCISRIEHASYLGQELEKAHLALRYHLEYVQDAPLDLARMHKKTACDALKAKL
jgi:dihydropteroate synthase